MEEVVCGNKESANVKNWYCVNSVFSNKNNNDKLIRPPLIYKQHIPIDS